MAVSSYDTSTDTDLESSTAVTVQRYQSFSGAGLYDPLTSSSSIATYSQPTHVALTVPDHALIPELQP